MIKKVVIETGDAKEARLMTMIYSLASTIDELNTWRRELENGKVYTGSHLVDGKLMTPQEIYDQHIPLEKVGQQLFTVEDIVYKIDEILPRNVANMVYSYIMGEEI